MSEEIKTSEELEVLEAEIRNAEKEEREIQNKLIEARALEARKEEIKDKKEKASKALDEALRKMPADFLGHSAAEKGKDFSANPYDIRNEPEKYHKWFAGWLIERIDQRTFADPVELEPVKEAFEIDDEKLEKLVVRATKAFYKKEHENWMTLYSKFRRKFYIFAAIILVFNFATIWFMNRDSEPEIKQPVVEQVESQTNE